jgi:MFS family permease
MFWTGAFTSNIGTWMETVAVGILVTTATGQAGWAGLVAAAGFVPQAVVGPFGGALADRLPRRTLILATTTVQTILAGTLCFLAAVGEAHPLTVTLIVLGAGCAQALGFPSFQAILPDLVPRNELPAAVALGSAQWNLGRVIGPALAGIVITLGGFEWAFAINTVSFLAVIAAVAPLELPPPPHTHGESIPSAIRNGARFALTEPGIRSVIGYLSMNSLLAAPFIALVPAVALEVFHSGESGTAVLVTAQGLGAVTMALLLGNLIARLGNRRLLRAVLTGLPIALLGYALAPELWIAAIAIFFVGLFYLGCLSSFTTIAQLRAPPELRGRVMSALMVLLGTLYPIGSILQGAIADQTSLRVTTGVAAALLGLWLVAIRVLHPGYDRHLDDIERVDDTPLPGGSVPAT